MYVTLIRKYIFLLLTIFSSFIFVDKVNFFRCFVINLDKEKRYIDELFCFFFAKSFPILLLFKVQINVLECINLAIQNKLFLRLYFLFNIQAFVGDLNVADKMQNAKTLLHYYFTRKLCTGNFLISLKLFNDK